MEAAVVTASHGAMASLLGKLGDLLTDKYKLIKEAKGQIRFLKAELESMHAFLKRMSDTEEPDEKDKCWAKEVRELSYDIEDSINEFMLRVERQPSKPPGFKGFIDRSMNLLTTMNTRHEIAKEFEGLKSRVKEVTERRTRYKVDDAVSKPKDTTIDLRLLAIYAETSGLVGIEGPRDELIQLMDEEGVSAHERKVLSIVGFGGLGKTTLANEIYRKLEGKFKCRALVFVSQKPNIRRILRMILSQVGFKAPEHTNMETWDAYEMITALREFLLDKRYLIVIDDIWDASAWHIITCALLENRNGSRVITTTRIETVAGECCSNQYDYIYKMKPLDGEDSRRLFFKRVFGSEDACPRYLKEVSDQILKMCGGLPLAIITVSSLLASQPNQLKAQWQHVHKSLGSNFEVSPTLEGMRQILNLSYIHLPHYLKSCMLYLGIYPEDYTIAKNDLARQWTAEGFISKAHGTDPEHVAKSYFNELINRSMIQPADTDYNGEVVSCKVHDMMLDLIIHKSREENFITVIDDVQDLTGQNGKIRRLSLQLDGAIDDDRVVGSVPLSQIRMLARFGTSSYLPPFALFKHLRVLTIEIPEGSQSLLVFLDFSAICHLFQLRYLRIAASYYHVVLLPSKIGGLQQLETFYEVETRSSSLQAEGQQYQQLPMDIVHMSRLSCLIVPSWRTFPDGIGYMKSLHTLRGFNLAMEPDNLKGLGELTNLTDLEIVLHPHYGNSIPSDKLAERGREVLRTCLEKLCNLRYLCLKPMAGSCLDVFSSVPASFCHLQRFHVYNSWFSRVPEWIGQLHDLCDLKLVINEVLEEDVGKLAQLPSLTQLSMNILRAPEDKIIIRGSWFPVLKHFQVRCSRMSYWTFKAGAMARLERLVLYANVQKEWERYGAAPAGIKHLPALKGIDAHIEVECTDEPTRRAVESMFKDAVNMHPGRPTANILCEGMEYYSSIARYNNRTNALSVIRKMRRCSSS
uniref:AAA+ ATPase domain-containing protein n=1 Tax=Arundo donax TaxID=35708 RepID=A0A0A9CVP8_ARUDO